jgi:hypothetical protein
MSPGITPIDAREKSIGTWIDSSGTSAPACAITIAPATALMMSSCPPGGWLMLSRPPREGERSSWQSYVINRG